MLDRSYRVLRPMLTDAGGRHRVVYRPGDRIIMEDESRAAYLIEAGFIANRAGAPTQAPRPGCGAG